MAPENHKIQSGTLFVVATPIGNLEDITLRALATLRAVDIVACEDTRKTGRLLQKHGIKKRLLSFYQPKEKHRIPVIMGHLLTGKTVALVSDAGTPGISDPGYSIIREAAGAGIEVVPIPGPSAVTAALSAGGLPTHRFLFLGFPPPKKAGLKKMLISLQKETATLVFYLPVRKIQAFLEAVLETLGDRPIVIARELTKMHEEFIRGIPSQLLESIDQKPLRGEATLLVEGTSRKKTS